MLISIFFNGDVEYITSIEDLGEALNRFDEVTEFELWMLVTDGSSMRMLRNYENAWLLYLRHENGIDSHSFGGAKHSGTEKYTLSNGQKDEYPTLWCIDVEQCYKAMAYFFVNEGLRPEWIHWRES